MAASNALFDSVLHALQERSILDQQVKYDLALSNCQTLLRPLQTVRVLYYDPEQSIDINDDLYILEATLEWNSNDLHTTGLVVSTHDHWPKGANDNAAARAIQGKVFAGHKQISVNEWESHKEMLIGNDDTDTPIISEFPFIFSLAVVQVMQVYFRFKVEQILAAVYTYALADDETEQNISENVGPANITDTDNSLPTSTDVVDPTTTVSGTNDTSQPSNGNTSDYTGGTDDEQQGGGPIATQVNPTGEIFATDTPANDATGSPQPDAISDTESAAGDPHTHNIEHTHFHVHDHAAELPQHIHDVPHTHAVDHAHAMAHVHDMEHTHEMDHVHNVEHDHPSPVHVHGLPDLTETVGLVRFPALTTYALSDLEYAVNGGAWVGLEVATDASDGYWQIDITTDVRHPTIPFRPAQASGNNVIEIRRKTAAGTGKSALVSVVLYCRTTIQGITLS